MSSEKNGALLVAVSAIGFGFNPIFARIAYESGASVSTVLFIRFAIGSSLLWLTLFVHGRRQPLARGVLFRLALAGFSYAVTAGLYFTSVKYISGSLAALVLYSYPALVTISVILINREGIPGTTIGVLIVSLVGVALVLGFSLKGANLLGIVLAFLSAVAYTTYYLIGSRMLKAIPARLATAFITATASLLFLVYGLADGTLSLQLTVEGWLACLGVGVVSTAIAMLALFAGLASIGASTASIISTLEPVTTVAAGVVLLQEPFGLGQLFGGILIICSTILLSLSNRCSAIRVYPTRSRMSSGGE